jgi:hypothetical protein
MSERNEVTSKEIASLAAKALREPESLSFAEIRRLAASNLTQRPDREPEDDAPRRGPP